MAFNVISARQPSFGEYIRTVYAYRGLMMTFARRDLRIRYAQTYFGRLWIVAQPLIALAIFTLFFGELIPVDTGGIPYPLFAFSGMVAWYYFSFMVRACGLALTEAQDIVYYIYFPKLVLPVSRALVGLLEFGVSLVLMGGMMVVAGYGPGWELLLLPVFVLLLVLLGLTAGIWLSALTVRFRDLQHFVPYIVNFGIWLTPVFYPGTLIPPQYSFLIYANPVAGVIAGFRWSFLGGAPPSPWYAAGFAPVILLFFLGIWYFRKVEKDMVDLV